MTIVVGYPPRREGLAALEAAVGEAVRTGEALVVVALPVADGHGGQRRPDARDVADACRPLGPAGYVVRPGEAGRGVAEQLEEAVTQCLGRLLVTGIGSSGPPGGPDPRSALQELLSRAPCDVLVVHARQL